MAGAVGFGPTNAGSKSRCLTEMHMKNDGLLGLIFLEYQKPGARVERMWREKIISTKRNVKKNTLNYLNNAAEPINPV